MGGQLDFYLALPRNPLWHILISRTHMSALGDLLFGVGLYFFSKDASAFGFLVLLLMIACSGVIFVSYSVIAHSSAFFFGNSENFGRLYSQALMTFSLYPSTIFAGLAAGNPTAYQSGVNGPMPDQ